MSGISGGGAGCKASVSNRRNQFSEVIQIGRSDASRNKPFRAKSGWRISGKRTLRAGFALLVILGVLIDMPYVERAPSKPDILDRQHRGHHGMVLVVVFVHSVAAHQM